MPVRLPVGPNGSFLRSNPATATGLDWHGNIRADGINAFLGVGAGPANLAAANITGATGFGSSALGALITTVPGASTANTAVGSGALSALQTGNNNTAMGFQALAGSDNGSQNTAFGSRAMTMAMGVGDTAIGYQVFGSATQIGGYNVGVGNNAMTRISSSSARNIGIGSDALSVGSGTFGSNNIVIGEGAGSSITGSDNIILGMLPGASGDGRTYIDNIDNPIGSSFNIRCATDGSGLLGRSGSSKRFKENINELPSSGEKLDQLNPVTFTYISDGPDAEIQMGMIAEEMVDLYPDTVFYMKDERVKPREEAPMILSGIYYERFITILIKETQDLRARVAALEKQLGAPP